MVSLQILKSNYSPLSVSQSNYLRKNSCFCSEFSSDVAGKRTIRFNNRRNSKLLMIHRRFSVCCKVKEGDNQSNGEWTFHQKKAVLDFWIAYFTLTSSFSINKLFTVELESLMFDKINMNLPITTLAIYILSFDSN